MSNDVKRHDLPPGNAAPSSRAGALPWAGKGVALGFACGQGSPSSTRETPRAPSPAAARGRLAALIGGLTGATFLVPSPLEWFAAAGGLSSAPAGARVIDQAMTLVGGVVIWALVAWVALVLVGAALARVPGAAGGWGLIVLRGLAPAAARRLAVAAVGTALVGGTATACAAPPSVALAAPAGVSGPSVSVAPAPPSFPVPAPASTGQQSPGIPSAMTVVDLDWPRAASSIHPTLPTPAPVTGGSGQGRLPATDTSMQASIGFDGVPASSSYPGDDLTHTPRPSVSSVGDPSTLGAPAPGAPARDVRTHEPPATPSGGADRADPPADGPVAPQPPVTSTPVASTPVTSGLVSVHIPDLSWPGTSGGAPDGVALPTRADPAAGGVGQAGQDAALPAPGPLLPAAGGPTPPPPSAQNLPAPRTPAPAPARVSAMSAAPVTVLPGDSLWSIADAHLPATANDVTIARAVDAWYRANAAVIGDDPDLIHAGQLLMPPPADDPGDPR